MKKPRSPLIAVVLQIIFPGLGHIYCGQFKRWLLRFYVPGVVILSGTIFIYLYTHLFWILAGMLVLSGSLCYIAPLIDVVILSRRSQDYELKWFNKGYWYLSYCIALIVLVAPISSLAAAYIREDLVQAFRIPSAAMSPTLLVGDHILVDKRIYRSSVPMRGDIVAFEYPEDRSKVFVKRIVGFPAETVEIRDKAVYVNGNVLSESYALHLDPIVLAAAASPRDIYGPVLVPEDSYFVLGDNRDQSLDSRFFGFVPKNYLKGKLFHIYFSRQGDGTIIWSRIGSEVM
jgi:signal peptidase I